MSYGHAERIATLPPCADCRHAPAWLRSDVDGRPLCGRCSMMEQLDLNLPDGLRVRSAPALPRGYQIKCDGCHCSVSRDHVTDSDDCQGARDERLDSIAS